MSNNPSYMIILKRRINTKNQPFIVAEISANHNNNLNRALKLIDEAKKAGAHAVKIQTYTADTLTIKSNKKDFQIKRKNPWSKNKNLWNKRS